MANMGAVGDRANLEWGLAGYHVKALFERVHQP
jgi:hypothetical protein